MLLGGLLPLADAKQKGLMSVDQYKSTYMSIETNTSGLIKICRNGIASYICSITTYGTGALISISNAWEVSNIRASRIGNSALNDEHYNIYRDSEGSVYVYSGASTGFNVSILRSSSAKEIIMEESDVDKESLIKLL